MLELTYGRVKGIRHQGDKWFGFLTVEVEGKPTGEEAFFHSNNGRFVEFTVDGNNIEFIDPEYDQLPMWEPSVGELIAFHTIPGKGKDPVASPWTYGDAYYNRLCWFYASSITVMRETGLSPNEAPSTVEVAAVGTPDELSALYPVEERDGRLYDPFADITQGNTWVRYSFVQWCYVGERDGERGPA